MGKKIMTGFDLYLQNNPGAENQSAKQPVVYFEAGTDQPGMRDFRPKQLPIVEVSSEEDPKGSSVMVTAPTLPTSQLEGAGESASAEKAPSPLPPGQQIKKTQR